MCFLNKGVVDALSWVLRPLRGVVMLCSNYGMESNLLGATLSAATIVMTYELGL